MKVDKIAFMVKEPNPLAIVADIPAGTEPMVKTCTHGQNHPVTAVVAQTASSTA